VHVGYEVYRWNWDRFLSQYYAFPLSVLFHQLLILIHQPPTLYELSTLKYLLKNWISGGLPKKGERHSG
jgi:hypothetical protein